MRTTINLYKTEKGDGYFAAVDEGPELTLKGKTGLYLTKESTKDGKTYLRLSIFPLQEREEKKGGGDDDGI